MNTHNITPAEAKAMVCIEYFRNKSKNVTLAGAMVDTYLNDPIDGDLVKYHIVEMSRHSKYRIRCYAWRLMDAVGIIRAHRKVKRGMGYQLSCFF